MASSRPDLAPEPDSDTSDGDADDRLLLLLGADHPDRERLAAAGAARHHVVRVAGLTELDQALRGMASVLVLDGDLVDLADPSFLRELRQRHPYLAVVLVVTAAGETALRMLPGETVDGYLVPERGELALFDRVIELAIEKHALRRKLKQHHQFSYRLSKVVERTHNSVVITDLDGSARWINRGFQRLSGRGLGDIAGRRHYRELAGPSTDPATLESIDRAIAAVEPLRFEIQYHRPDGDPYWVGCTLEPMSNEIDIIGFMFVELDISDSKAQQRRLELSEERLRLALWATGDGLWDWDLRDDTIYASPGWYAMLGRTPPPAGERLTAAAVRELVHPEDAERIKTKLDAHLAGRCDAVADEIRMRQENGAYRWVALRAKVASHDAHGRPARIVGMNRDVQQRVLQHRELEVAKQRSEEAAAAKTRFLAAMSHGLQTPLGGVIGTNELLLDTELEDEQRQFVESSLRSAETLLQRINGILEYSRLDAGDIRFTPSPFILYELVDDAVGTFVDELDRGGTELVTRVDPELPDIVKGDYQRIRQIVCALLAKSLMASAGGEVVLSLSRGAAQPLEVTCELRIRVEGDAFADDDCEDVFRVVVPPRTPGSDEDGLNLELASCKLLVEAMGGNCGWTAVPAGRTTLTCCLPVEYMSGSAVPRSIAADLDGMHVLVYHSTRAKADGLGDMLRSLRAHPLVVTTIDQAQSVLETDSQPVDFLLLFNGCPRKHMLKAAIARRPVEARPRLIELVDRSAALKEKLFEEAPLLRLPARRRHLLSCLSGETEGLPAELAVGEIVQEQAGGAEPPAGERPRILVVEDDPVSRKVYRTVLRRLGCDFDTVENGREAVLAVLRHDYDLVLMDIVMPVMDGLKSATTIRDLLPAERRPVIVALSADSGSTDADLCRSAGISEFIPKPIYKEDLVNLLERWYHRRSP